jgi:hypothetical protein
LRGHRAERDIGKHRAWRHMVIQTRWVADVRLQLRTARQRVINRLLHRKKDVGHGVSPNFIGVSMVNFSIDYICCIF